MSTPPPPPSPAPATGCPFSAASCETASAAPAPQAPSRGGCPITRIKNFFSFRAGVKATRFGAIGTASFFTLCGIKCIALYVVLPSVLAGAALTSGDNAAADESASVTASHAIASQESDHESVPVSCPFHRMLNGGGKPAGTSSLLEAQD